MPAADLSLSSNSFGQNQTSDQASVTMDRRDSSVSSSGFIGSMSKEQREEKVRKHFEKKKRRKSQKFVRY